MPSLHQIDSNGSVQRSWNLPAGRTVLGRGSRCGVSIDDRGISREHAAFEVYDDERVAYIDLGSANGSFVNDLPVRRIFLRDGDTIRLGATYLRFFESCPPAADEAAGSEAKPGAGKPAAGGSANRRAGADSAAVSPGWSPEPVPPETAILLEGLGEKIPPEWQTMYGKVRSLVDVIRLGAGAAGATELLERAGPSVLMACAAARMAYWKLPEGEAASWALAAEVFRPGSPSAGWPAYPMDQLRAIAGRPGPSRLRASKKDIALEPASQAGQPSPRGSQPRAAGGVRALALPIWDHADDPLNPPAADSSPAAPSTDGGAPPHPPDTPSAAASSSANASSAAPVAFSAPSLPPASPSTPLPDRSRPVALLYFEAPPGGDGLGAADEEFLLAVGRVTGSLALRLQALDRLTRDHQVAQRALDDRLTIVSASRRFQEVLAQVDRLSAADTTVLILGESGTGKELIARALHRSSRRRGGPLVCVNCSSLPENLVESELFGHERGAFTGAIGRKKGQFELADGGTLFLDEIGDMPAPAQAKLLRVLETGEAQRVGGERPVQVDVRIIAATNKDLAHESAEGRFREDLYYRLNVVALRLPPLRERPEDVEVLVRYFLKTLRPKVPSPLRDFSSSALRVLSAYSWPGNVRQLRNIVERALVFANSETGGVDLLPSEVSGSMPPDATLPAWTEWIGEKRSAAPPPDESPAARPGAPSPGGPPPLPASGPPEALPLAEIERLHIQKVLRHCDGNKQRAAALLGISRSTLYEKLKDSHAPGPEDNEEAGP